ncbi:hypothetical protein GIB67_035479 [Kingdonia uniflora]|uniref:Helitron helicase-like domain-containing protein n=1 Tax=Kingdonia uniflora TaxID=39325 RepID=A0A7J7P0F4_9MAGN|nr:hypothetical protein GIB67_035479 [Kingdonia uniflora]
MQVLYDDDSSHAKSFRSHIREYNAANAFTNLGVKLDDRILNGRGPKPFSIYGELKHRVGALLPDLGKQTAYIQLYNYDSASALNARVTRNPQLDTNVLKIIQDNLMEYNPFVRIYRQAYEVLNDVYSADNQDVNVHAHLHYSSRTDRCRYNLPSTDEIAVILPGDGQEAPSTRDIVVYLRGGHELMRISECYPAYLPMHYVLLFPHVGHQL